MELLRTKLTEAGVCANHNASGLYLVIKLSIQMGMKKLFLKRNKKLRKRIRDHVQIPQEVTEKIVSKAKIIKPDFIKVTSDDLFTRYLKFIECFGKSAETTATVKAIKDMGDDDDKFARVFANTVCNTHFDTAISSIKATKENTDDLTLKFKNLGAFFLNFNAAIGKSNVVDDKWFSSHGFGHFPNYKHFNNLSNSQFNSFNNVGNGGFGSFGHGGGYSSGWSSGGSGFSSGSSGWSSGSSSSGWSSSGSSGWSSGGGFGLAKK
jgi:hypothetical protein